MSTYSQKLDIAKEKFRNHCIKCIRHNWDRMFDMWLLCDANMAFGHGYIDILKEQFSEYMTSEIESNLFFAGSNIAYSIQAFMAYKKNSKLNDVLKFTEHFLSKQFDDFDNWCSEIMMAMPDEEDAEESQDPS